MVRPSCRSRSGRRLRCPDDHRRSAGRDQPGSGRPLRRQPEAGVWPHRLPAPLGRRSLRRRCSGRLVSSVSLPPASNAGSTGPAVVAFAPADRLERRGRTGSASAVAGPLLPAAVAAAEPVGELGSLATVLLPAVFGPQRRCYWWRPFSRGSAEADLAIFARVLVAAIRGAGLGSGAARPLGRLLSRWDSARFDRHRSMPPAPKPPPARLPPAPKLRMKPSPSGSAGASVGSATDLAPADRPPPTGGPGVTGTAGETGAADAVRRPRRGAVVPGTDGCTARGSSEFSDADGAENSGAASGTGPPARDGVLRRRGAGVAGSGPRQGRHRVTGVGRPVLDRRPSARPRHRHRHRERHRERPRRQPSWPEPSWP